MIGSKRGIDKTTVYPFNKWAKNFLMISESEGYRTIRLFSVMPSDDMIKRQQEAHEERTGEKASCYVLENIATDVINPEELQ